MKLKFPNLKNTLARAKAISHLYYILIFFLYYVDDGEGYSITESLRFLEEVANASLSLSNIIVNSAWYGAEVLRRHGSPELKVS